jgi:BASS family bile acid:Na+ symporter
MLGVGFSLTIQTLAQSIKNLRMVFFALLTNFVIIPIVVIGISLFLFLPLDIEIGFIILSFAAGAAFTPKLAQFAKANIAYAVGLMTLLVVTTVIVLPLVLPLIISGVAVTPLDIAEPLILIMLLPLGIALAIRHRYQRFSERTSKLLNLVATISLLILLFLFFVAYWPMIISAFGTGAILLSIFLFSFALAIGYLLSIKDIGIKRASSLSAAQRNISAGLLVALVDFTDKPLVGVTVVVISIVGLILLMIVAIVWGRVRQQ